ncbi:isoleucine--tRNA ligase [Myxococcota bacterium]|nr:isoleucine--tRNA ligase [Myxococcota bacterium]
MAFDKVDQQVPDFPALENRILELWKAKNVFHRTLEESQGRPDFVFYEGPPTANGLPHNGHVLTRVIKDLFPRYMTMRGYHVERRAGWDTHGLPVEVEVEKELKIQGREAIIGYGVEAFVRRCLESVFRYTSEWEHLTERIGFWVDLDKAYVTYHKPYVESVWWALSELFKKGLLYKGHKVVWWWAQGGTALSSGEVGNAYKTVDDPSVYVRFPLVGEDASLVVWTTTPWTLSSNMFAAVHGEIDYVYAKDPETGHVLVVAEALCAALGEKLGRTLEVQKRVRGSQLIGKRYVPPFDTYRKTTKATDDRYWRVVPGDRSSTTSPDWFVALDTGTGVVHLAPAFGEDDWKVWRNEKKARPDVDMLCAVRPDGRYSEVMADLGLENVWVKDADRPLIRMLRDGGVLLHEDVYRHEYPFCWRSDTDPLIQYAREAWFIKTTAKIDQVIENNQGVVWYPEHVKDGRFGDFLAGNVDWALSRERFWGTPLNIWTCSSCGKMEAPSSVAEIEARNPHAFDHFRAAVAADPTISEHLMVHKPWIDAVTMECPSCKGTMNRVPEVIDCWFDSGCMPFAQLGYPHVKGSKEAFRHAFPADFISEAIDQTRGWFYSLMMISNLLFEKHPSAHPYKRCIVLGHVLDKHGKKESKSSGNYTPPEVILDAVRMEFAPIALEAIDKGAKLPKEGEALIGQDDLDGLDLKEGDAVLLYRAAEPSARRTVKLKVHKKLKRRVIVLSDEDRHALHLELGAADVLPSTVPSRPANMRVMLEAQGVPAPGADAFRWFFYASNPPWNSTRHSLSNVRGLQKELPIKLRSVYSFFVTYANIDDFDPVKDEKAKRAPKDRPLLDRWILSELEMTKRDVVAHMDAYRSYEAAQTLSRFVEALSNWYVRRSRARFWAEGRGQDKLDAYWTLYQCLRDFSVMIAPFLPFAAEDMYQNLVVKAYGSGHPDSVHLRSYPTGDASRIDEQLSHEMAIVRDLVSLGLQVRASNKLKTRQPLAEAQLVLAEPAMRAALESYAPVMADELNVLSVKFLDRADAFVTYKVKPNFQALGKRLGAKMKATSAAIAAADPLSLKRALDDKGEARLQVDGDTVVLTKDELLVQVEAKEGFAAAGSGAGVIIVDTKLTDALVEEGLFREVLSKIQAQRKELRLDFAARIKLGITGSERVIAACRTRLQALKEETLATEVKLGEGFGGQRRDVDIEKELCSIDIVDLGVPGGRGA